MRRLLLASLLLLPAAGAFAADLPSSKDASPYLAPMPAFTWSGFYGGVEGGADFLRATGSSFNSSQAAGLVGGLVGYNYQFNRVVVGVEGDGGAALGASKTVLNTSPLNGYANVTSGSNYYGDIRGRLGYTFADRALVYTTGGAAFGDVATSYFNSLVGGLPISLLSNRTGWTAGVGVDYAVTDNWFGRIEYRYRDLGRASAGSGYDRVSLTTNALLVGLVFKFGGADIAVAKY